MATSLPERDWLARRASGHNTAQMAAAVISASPNHSVIYQSVGLNLHCLGDAAKTGLSRIGARPARLHHGGRFPCNGEGPSRPRHGEAGPRKFVVTRWSRMLLRNWR